MRHRARAPPPGATSSGCLLPCSSQVDAFGSDRSEARRPVLDREETVKRSADGYKCVGRDPPRCCGSQARRGTLFRSSAKICSTSGAGLGVGRGYLSSACGREVYGRTPDRELPGVPQSDSLTPIRGGAATVRVDRPRCPAQPAQRESPLRRFLADAGWRRREQLASRYAPPQRPVPRILHRIFTLDIMKTRAGPARTGFISGWWRARAAGSTPRLHARRARCRAR